MITIEKANQIIDLVVKAKYGEEEAIKALIEQYKPFIFKECSKYRIPSYDFEDLVQHSYLSLIKAINQFSFGKSSFTTYVMTSISNNLKYLLRGSIKHNREIQDESNFNILPSDYAFTIEDEIIAFEEVRKLYEAMDKLTSEERSIIEDFYIHEKSMGDIADEMGVSYGGVNKKKRRVLMKLEKMLR